MAISFVNVGAWAVNASTSTYSLTPALPASWAAGDMLVAFVHFKTSSASLDFPAGWTVLGAVGSSVSGSYAADTGDVVCYLLYRIAVAGDTAPTFGLLGGSTGNTGNNFLTQIAAYRSGTGAFQTPFLLSGGSVASSTSWSMTLTASRVVVNGELIVTSVGWMSDAPTQSAQAYAQTSATFSARTVQTKGSGTSGSDMSGQTCHATCTGSGSASTLTFTATMSATAYGAAVGAVLTEQVGAPVYSDRPIRRNTLLRR